MTNYNCIIKELPVDGQAPAKLLGHIFLQDLSQIPDSWEVKLRRSIISHDTDLQKLMCTSTNPLVIYQKSTARVSFDEEDLTARNHLDKTVEGYLVECEEFDFDCCVKAELQSSFATRFDVEAGLIDGIGVETSVFWKSYSHGMNLAGECSNMECDSNTQDESEGNIFYQSGFGEINLPDDENKFNCPACGHSSFNISNFVLSCGRALFRYKKNGIDSEVYEAILESDGTLEEYKTFDTKTDQPITSYDFISIMTVAANQSFYYCISCDKIIEEVEDEEMLSCGHSYHKSTCSPGSTIGCIVCQSEPLDSISVLLTVANN